MTTTRDSWKNLTWWQKSLAVLTCCLALYALFGFLLLPRIIRYVLVEKVSPVLHRQVSVQDIRYNPFTLTADMTDFAISEKDGNGEFVAFDALHANVELSSLLRLALVVHDMRLDGPRLHIRLDRNGQTNFADLTPAPDKARPEKSGEPMLLPLIVKPFSLGNGTLVFDDQTKGVTHIIDQINFQLPQFSSRKKDWETFMTPTLSFRVNGAPFSLQGQTTPFDNSLRTEFDLNVIDLDLPQYWAYALANENLKLAKGFLNFESKLVFERHEDTLPTFSLQGTITGRDIELTDDGDPVLSAVRSEIVMDDISILNLNLGLRSVTLESPFIKLVRKPDGKLNWMGYFTPGTDSNATATSAKNAANATEQNATALLLQAPQMRLTDGRILFRDETLQTPFTKDITALELTITDLSTAENATTLANFQARTAEGEEIGADASFSIFPVQVNARINARNLEIPSYSSYFKDALPLALTSAKADARISLAVNGTDKAPRMEDSELEVRDLTLKGPGNSGDVQVKRVTLDKIFVDMAGHGVRTGVLTLERPAVSTGVDANGHAALLGALRSSSPPATDSKPSESDVTPWSIACAGASVANMDLRLLGAATAPPLRLNSLQVGPVAVDTAKTAVTVGPVDMNLAVDLVRQQNGDINLATLFASEQSATPSKEAAPAWNVAVEKFSLSDSQIAFTDETLAKPVRLDVDQIAFLATNLSTDLTKTIPLTLACRVEERGTIKASGDLVPSTLTTQGSVALAKIPLSLASAYVTEAANIEIPSGLLGGKLDWRMGAKAKDQITGSLLADGLRITEGRSKAEVGGFKSMSLQKITLQLSPLALSIGSINVLEPRGSFLIDAQGKTTLDRIAPVAAKGSKPAVKATKGQPEQGLKSMDIGTVTLKRGRFTFADKTLSPQYQSVISPVDLTVSGFSLDPARRTQLDLTAIIDGSAPITAKGWISPLKNPMEANSTVTLRNLDLVSLSPYSGKYIAYPVTRGQLDWDMNLNTEGSTLAMGNSIKAKQLELGDKVESPDAADVPVKLGLALLRDMSGNIAISLPVKGDLNDPKFNIGGIVMQAFLGLIVKAIASPFTLLASLVPEGGGEDMGRLIFPPGLSTPAPETVQSMQALAEVLNQRPGLRISLSGHADPATDRQAMEDSQFLRKLQTVKYDDLSRKVRENTVLEELEITDEEYADVLWEAYKDEPVEKEKNAIGLHKEVPRETQEAKLRELIHVTDEDLVRLAANRADVVKNHLVQNLGVDAGRIFLGQTGPQALSGKHEVTVDIQQ